MRGMNTTSDGSTLMINNYMTTNDVFSNPMSGGYRRAGIDIHDLDVHTPQELGEILGVDCIIMGTFAHESI